MRKSLMRSTRTKRRIHMTMRIQNEFWLTTLSHVVHFLAAENPFASDLRAGNPCGSVVLTQYGMFSCDTLRVSMQ